MFTRESVCQPQSAMKMGWQWAAGRRNSYDEAYFAFHYKLAYLSQEQIGKHSMIHKQAFTFQYSATVLPKGLLSWFPQTPLIEHLFLVLLPLLDAISYINHLRWNYRTHNVAWSELIYRYA